MLQVYESKYNKFLFVLTLSVNGFLKHEHALQYASYVQDKILEFG